MANELRVRANGIGGKVEDNPLTAAATILTSAGLAAVPVIGTTQHLAVVLDPDGIDGAPEIVWVTAHAAAATTATILRGQEGTTAREHLRDIDWIHGATVADAEGIAAAYTTVWSANGGTAPALGNGTLTARYRLMGKLCWLRIGLAMGSTTTFGVGVWGFTLPDNITTVTDSFIVAYAAKAAARYPGVAYVQGNNIVRIPFTQGSDGAHATSPFGWADGDVLHITGTFEIN